MIMLRKQPVLIDADVAGLYGVKTKHKVIRKDGNEEEKQNK